MVKRMWDKQMRPGLYRVANGYVIKGHMNERPPIKSHDRRTYEWHKVEGEKICGAVLGIHLDTLV